jgi:hypothetical protein
MMRPDFPRTHRMPLMTRRLILSAALLFALLAPLSSARAETRAPAARQGDWDTREIKLSETNQFAYCATEAHYENGLVLIFARNAAEETNLIIGFPGGNLTEGADYAVQVKVDSAISRDLTGHVAQKELLIIPTGTDEELYGKFRSGSVLTITAPEDSVAFKLQGTGKALDDLRDCAAAHADRLAAFPPALRGILVAAGLDRARPVQVERAESTTGASGEDPVDFAWMLGPVLGGAVQRPLPEDWTGAREQFDAMIEQYFTGLKPQCGGEFVVSKDEVQDLGFGFLQKADVYCTREDESNLAALALYVDPQGFTVFFHEGKGAGEELATQARDNIALVLAELARRLVEGQAEVTPAPEAASAPAAPASGGQ